MSFLKKVAEAQRSENDARPDAADTIVSLQPKNTVAKSFDAARRNYGSKEDRDRFFRKDRRMKAEEAISGPTQRATFNVIQVIAYDPSANWTMFKARNLETDVVEKVKGEIISKPAVGDVVTAFGSYTNEQEVVFEARGLSIDYGNENAAAYRFLNERISNVGETTAKKLKTHFGDQLSAAMTKVDMLVESGLVTQEKAEDIVARWMDADAFEKLYIQLRSFNVGPKTAQRVALKWGNEALSRAMSNPWDLYREIDGIGFLTADRIALSMGKGATDANRIDASLSFALDEATQEHGHMWISRGDLISRATEILESTSAPVRQADIEARFDPWQQFTKFNGAKYCVVVEVDGQQRIYPVPLWNAEKRIVEQISNLLMTAPKEPLATPEKIRSAMQKSGLEEDESQYAALFEATHNGFAILTGKPGCGKTTITKTFLDLAEGAGIAVTCCSPTGKAADRFREATGRKASTIHSLLMALEMQSGDAKFPSGILVVDESSMKDAKIMRRLLDRVEPGTRVLLVGDGDQLQPVDPGQPFLDLIESGCVPIARLQNIHRQGKNSGIIAAAHSILAGISPREDEKKPDFKYTKISEPRDDDKKALVAEAAAESVVESVVYDMSRRGFDPVEDTIVLTPKKDGKLGTRNLNYLLKNALNPQDPAAVARNEFFKFKTWMLDVGDRVIHMKNNKKLGVFNGNIGTVIGFGTTEDEDGNKIRAAIVRIKDGQDGRIVYYDKATASRELQLAYAITIHKSQGSEFPAAIVLCAKEHFKLLERRLVYTAITRGKKFVHLFAQPWALKTAVETVGAVKRNTGLVKALRDRMKELGITYVEAPNPEIERQNALAIAGASADFEQKPSSTQDERMNAVNSLFG